jgi:hypothetical protein
MGTPIPTATLATPTAIATAYDKTIETEYEMQKLNFFWFVLFER